MGNCNKHIEENLPSQEAIVHSIIYITLLPCPVIIRSVNHPYQMCINMFFVLHACYSSINLSEVLTLVSHAFYRQNYQKGIITHEIVICSVKYEQSRRIGTNENISPCFSIVNSIYF
jgi:hypothetical protein